MNDAPIIDALWVLLVVLVPIIIYLALSEMRPK